MVLSASQRLVVGPRAKVQTIAAKKEVVVASRRTSLVVLEDAAPAEAYATASSVGLLEARAVANAVVLAASLAVHGRPYATRRQASYATTTVASLVLIRGAGSLAVTLVPVAAGHAAVRPTEVALADVPT